MLEEHSNFKIEVNKFMVGLKLALNSRCRDLLLSSIKGETLPEGIDTCRFAKPQQIHLQEPPKYFLLRCEELATSLEEAIFTQFKQTNPKYKNQVLVF